jgi:hypothetical protein
LDREPRWLSPEGSRGDDDAAPRRRVTRRRSNGLAAWLTRLVGAAVIVAAGAAVYLHPGRPVPAQQNAATSSAVQVALPVDTGSATPAPLAATGSPPVAARVQPTPVPSADVLVLLIRNSLLALQQANSAGNYAVLRELAAPEAQQASTPARFSQAFAPLRDAHVDLSAIAVTNPSLSAPPTVGADGVLRLTGFFPTRQGQIDFSLAYRLSHGHWLPIGMTVSPPSGKPVPATVPLDAKKVPDDPSLITLIRGAILCLDQADATGDYAVLRETAAAGFRDSNSLDKLANNFAALRGRQLDLSPVAVITPRLFKKAAIDNTGYLRLTGYFPSRPEQVNFDLAFKYEDNGWRLFGIGLNTTTEVARNGGASGTAPSGQ